jgi:flagellin
MANVDVTRIASNIGALNSLWALQTVNKQLGVAQTRLSTGKRINSASDDPAGLTIATKLNSRSEGLKVALSNIGDSKNLLAVAEAGVGRITDILVQMKNKASQGASDTMGANERKAIQAQLDAYAQQIDDIVKQTNWNGNKLIDGSKKSNVLSFQTGADSEDVTDVSGLINLSATQENANIVTNGDSLKLASKLTAEAGATLTAGANTIATAAATPVVPDGTFAATLSSGTYTVRVTDNQDVVTTPASVGFVGNGTGQVASVDLTTDPQVAGTYSIQTRVTGAGTAGVPFLYEYKVIDAAGTEGAWTQVTDVTNPIDTGKGFSFVLNGSGTLTAVGGANEWGATIGAVTSKTVSLVAQVVNTAVDKIELLDAAGNAMRISSTAAGTGSGAASAIFDATAGGVFNFGNGLSVTLAGKDNATATPIVYEDSIAFTTAADAGSGYKVKSSGADGVSLDDTSGGRTAAGNYRELMSYLEGQLDVVNSMMSKIGAFTGRLEFKEDQVMAAQINVEASYNRIMNANMAEEQVNSSKFQILQQTAIALLAQANQAPASLLSLFR